MFKVGTILLGLDPGLADTGYGLISRTAKGWSCLAAGSIRTAARGGFSRRLQEIHEQVRALLKKYRPDLVAIEKLYFAKNVKTALDVAQARGVVFLALALAHKEIIEFTPLQVKQSLTGSGAASKSQVARMVKVILGLQALPSSDDASDALAIALTAAFTNRRLL